MRISYPSIEALPKNPDANTDLAWAFVTQSLSYKYFSVRLRADSPNREHFATLEAALEWLRNIQPVRYTRCIPVRRQPNILRYAVY